MEIFVITTHNKFPCLRCFCFVHQELNLNLYRHWSLYESLRHTIYTAAKFRIWLNKGKQRLSEFLAELGLPLVIILIRSSLCSVTVRLTNAILFAEHQ